MQTPIHFDLDAARERMKSDVTRVCDEAATRAPDDRNRVLVEMQRELALSLVESRVCMLGWHNDHQPPEAQVLALASQIGSVLGSFMLNCDEATRGLVMHKMHEAIDDCLHGGDSRDGYVRRGVIPGIQGGHA